MELNSDKCAHTICNCRAQPGSKYCSAYCEGIGDVEDIVCHCGHGHCDQQPKEPLVR